MIYGLIICAGKQSRFKSDIPKALMQINGTSLLERNIKAMTPYCDEIYTVCSTENQHHFKTPNKIVINSGKGSGDAVLKALEKLHIAPDDSCFIMWGDSLQNSTIFAVLKKNYHGVSLIPCTYEENPYVQIIPMKKDKVLVRFSKFGEPISAGFHDLSIFYCNAIELLEKLKEFQHKILDLDENYVHKHNNEMEFLDVFNETDLRANILDLKYYKAFSFNTLEQFQKLVDEENF